MSRVMVPPERAEEARELLGAPRAGVSAASRPEDDERE